MVIADFKRPEERHNQPVRFGSVRDLPALVRDAGFSQVKTEEMPFPRFHAGVGFVRADKSEYEFALKEKTQISFTRTQQYDSSKRSVRYASL